MSAMRGGNWGNGSMYDAGSGEAMGMAEFQALLRWYQATGTYPKRTIKIGLFDNEEGGLVGSGFYSQTNVSTLAAPAAAGDTNLKIVSRTGVGLAVGETILIDPFGSPETATITAVGTAGATGTGVTITPALASAHVIGAPLSAGVANVGGLIPDGPQGQYVMVANMDQNGIEYPARHFGTEHYLNDIVGGGVGPWYTNINAIPLHTTPNNLYDATAIQRIQHNLAAAQAFRDATADAVSQAFQVLGRKYNFSMPLENPLRFDQVGSTPVDPSPQSVPAYLPSDIAKYSPVVDDNTGRTDQVSFIRDWGIPGYGIIGAYDTSTNPQVGGNENPYPSEGLKRALELPTTWTSYVIAKDAYGGSEPRTDKPVAYFETSPAKPFLTSTVTFDASFSRNGGGQASGLEYYWDFGDGTTMATTNPRVTHEFSAKPS
jgi:PKD domain